MKDENAVSSESAPEKTTENMVPQSRLDDVIQERNKLRDKVDELMNSYSTYRAPNLTQVKPNDILIVRIHTSNLPKTKADEQIEKSKKAYNEMFKKMCENIIYTSTRNSMEHLTFDVLTQNW